VSVQQVEGEELVVSSGYDWSVRLWNLGWSKNPIATFESAEDYVFDVAWNPFNKTLFSTVDGDGYLDLWRLDNLEEPYLHH